MSKRKSPPPVNPRTPEAFKSLPKFIIGDDGNERNFVIHCHYPRFIMEFVAGAGKPIPIDSDAQFIEDELSQGREPAQSMARLMREAGEFFSDQLD